jgi:RNA polymerase sigma factor (sigma-70 family)
MDLSDDDLLHSAAAGDQDALAALLERHGPQVRRRLAGSVPRRWQAVLSLDDVMQEAYSDAFVDVRRFDPQTDVNFANWLTTLARRNLVDAVRMLEARKRGGAGRNAGNGWTGDSMSELYDLLVQTTSTPSRHAARNEASAGLEHAIRQLPAIQQRVVRLYDLERRPAEDVAAQIQRIPTD